MGKIIKKDKEIEYIKIFGIPYFEVYNYFYGIMAGLSVSFIIILKVCMIKGIF